MTRVYSTLLRLFPADVQFAYGPAMLVDFKHRLATAQGAGRVATAMFMISQVLALVCDAAAERINCLHSHRSFHGRRKPSAGVVRPPNMSKTEWLASEEYKASLRTQ